MRKLPKQKFDLNDEDAYGNKITFGCTSKINIDAVEETAHVQVFGFISKDTFENGKAKVMETDFHFKLGDDSPLAEMIDYINGLVAIELQKLPTVKRK